MSKDIRLKTNKNIESRKIPIILFKKKVDKLCNNVT